MKLSAAVAPAWDAQFANSRIHGETAQCELMREALRYCRLKRCAVDVGAHIGLWTRNLASRFEKVVAFEPVLENFECLQRNAFLPNVVAVNAALGALEQDCNMRMPEKGNSGCWHVAMGFETRMETLDAHGLSDVDLIKLDVEGYEGAVIRGAYETIRASQPVIVFEENGLGPRYFGAQWSDPKPILLSLGYTRRLRWYRDQIWTPAP